MYRGRFGIIAALRRALARAPLRPADPDQAEFAAAAFRMALRREPSPAELAHWAARAAGVGPKAVLDALAASEEYVQRRRVDDASEFPPGHYYSPVIDPEALRASGFRVDPDVAEAEIAGVDFRPQAMVAFWRRNLQVMQQAAFPAQETPPRRYYAQNDVYAWGDAHVLLAMFHELRPKRVLEVGSGFSSACMLDICDDLGLATRLTFVEPYPERLFSRLRPQDRKRCEILEIPVQALPRAAYEALEADDILFIDSTHVSKAGSDVNFELFEMLPRLKPGVVIHFHDTFYPFEYPEAWIFEARRSWNELYLLRALLMDNPRYEIVFFNDYFARKHLAEAAQVPKFLLNPGGGLWLRKLS